MARFLRSALRVAASAAPRSCSAVTAAPRQSLLFTAAASSPMAMSLRPLVTSASSFSNTFASRAYSTALTPDQQKELEKEYEHVTGLEREEVEGIISGKSRFDSEIPLRGPFGTAEAPFVVLADGDERIVGCTGGVGEHEHDTLWFKLKTDAPFECPVCSQVFKLQQIPH